MVRKNMPVKRGARFPFNTPPRPQNRPDHRIVRAKQPSNENVQLSSPTFVGLKNKRETAGVANSKPANGDTLLHKLPRERRLEDIIVRIVAVLIHV